MGSTLKRKSGGVKNAAVADSPGAIPASLEYGGSFFGAAVSCEHCGAAVNEGKNGESPDPHGRTLLNEARRVVYHAHAALARAGSDSLEALNAAGMLRDAARLLDLFIDRLRTRTRAEYESRKG